MSRTPPKPDLRTPGPRGLLTMRELLAFMRRVGGQLGFHVSSDDFLAVRDTGHGLHIRRRIRTAGLLIERQDAYQGLARVCMFDFADPIEDGFIIVRVRTRTFANGSYTETWTASGDVFGHVQGDEVPACDSIDYETTFDSGFDYGTFGSLEDDDTLLSGADAAAAASAAAVLDETQFVFTDSQSWLPEDWESASGTVRNYGLGQSSSRESFSVPGWSYVRPRYRLTNTGGARLKISGRWVPDGETPGGGGDITFEHILKGGATTGWQLAPAADPYHYYDGRIDRVRISPFFSVP